jgi:hypothetical protein
VQINNEINFVQLLEHGLECKVKEHLEGMLIRQYDEEIDEYVRKAKDDVRVAIRTELENVIISDVRAMRDMSKLIDQLDIIVRIDDGKE